MSFLKKEVSLPKLSAPKLPRRPPRGASDGEHRSQPQRRERQRGGRRASMPQTSGVTGLEITATQLVAAESGLQDGRIVARRAARRPLPDGLVKDGLVLDAEALGIELNAFFSEHKMGRKVRVGLATPRTILRVIDLPPLAEEDIPAALALRASDRIPMPLDRAVLDHQTVGLVDTPEGQRLRVIVVATERAATETLMDALRAGKLRPVGIDLSVFAAIRAVSDAEPESGPMLYAQLGDLVNIAITESGLCHFTRQAPQGLAYVLEELAQRRDITVPEAFALLDSAAGGDDPEAAGTDDAAGAVSDVREVGALLGRVATELGRELRAAAEFYGTQSGAAVGDGIVTGPLAALRGFVPALAEASGLTLSCGEASADDGALEGLDARVAPVAVGLGVEELHR